MPDTRGHITGSLKFLNDFPGQTFLSRSQRRAKNFVFLFFVFDPLEPYVISITTKASTDVEIDLYKCTSEL